MLERRRVREGFAFGSGPAFSGAGEADGEEVLVASL